MDYSSCRLCKIDFGTPRPIRGSNFQKGVAFSAFVYLGSTALPRASPHLSHISFASPPPSLLDVSSDTLTQCLSLSPFLSTRGVSRIRAEGAHQARTNPFLKARVPSGAREGHSAANQSLTLVFRLHGKERPPPGPPNSLPCSRNTNDSDGSGARPLWRARRPLCCKSVTDIGVPAAW